MSPRPWRLRSAPMRLFVAVGLMVFAAGCASSPPVARAGHIMVVDARGAPIKGAFVAPEMEDDRRTDPRKPTNEELAERVSDAAGVVQADLRLYYWASDDCFHFVITKEGYEDSTFSVSRELFPSMLKIRLEAVGNPGSAKPAPRTSP